MADDKPAAKDKEKPIAKEPAEATPIGPAPATAAALDEAVARLAAAEERVAAMEAKPIPSTQDFADMLAEIRAWARREIHLLANGASEEERETMNP